MNNTSAGLFPRLDQLPESMPAEGAVRIELEEGVPVFRASAIVQERIEGLLQKQQLGELTGVEEQEIERYEAIDDYLSFLNRLVRNQSQQKS